MMKFVKRLLPLLLVGVLFGSPVYAQATHIITSATLPTTCTVGDIYNKTGSSAGLYQCSATNTWTLLIDTTKTIDNIASSTSANLRTVLNDETGTGVAVFGTSPLITTALVVNGTFNYCADAGGTDAYACSLSPAITGYTTGAVYIFKANTANTGAASLNLNALGAKTVVKVAGGVSATLADSDIRAGQMVVVVYDGTNMQMLSMLGNATAGGTGIARTGTTTDLHAAIFDGTNADFVKDGGALFGFNAPVADSLLGYKVSGTTGLAMTPSSDFTMSFASDPGTMALSGTLAGVDIATISNTKVFTNKTLNCDSGTGNVCVHPVEFQFVVAASQATVDTLAFNTQSSGAATAGHTGTTVIQPFAVFPDGATSELQFTMKVPTNWSSSDAVEVFGKWHTPLNSGSVTWQVSGVCAADGEAIPTAYSATPDTQADSSKGTANQLNDFSITLSTASGHSLATCAAGEQLYIRFFAANSLGGGNAANLDQLGIRFRVTK